jgi:ABC-type multidrug transport system fused ATPase/permease subunit
MRRVSNLLAWGAVAVVAALIVLNWSTLTVPAPIDLVVAKIQAPLGVVMLGIAAVLVALFAFAYLQNLIGSLLETRRLLKEVQRVQSLADTAESSRIENLHQLIATEFRLLNERLNALSAPAAGPRPPAAEDADEPPAILPPPM